MSLPKNHSHLDKYALFAVCYLMATLPSYSLESYVTWATKAEITAGVAPGTITNSPLADLNGDGLPNLLAYTLGLSPTEPSAHLAPALESTTDGHQMVYWRDTNIADATLNIEVSQDLQNWHQPDTPGFPSGLVDTATHQHNGIQHRSLSIPPGMPAMFVRLRANILDPDAATYASATGLIGIPLDRLSNFLIDIKSTNVDLKLLTLGRSEFLARTGTTHRAVIGPNATITGVLGNTADGIEFDGGSGDIFEFDNPNPFTNSRIWQLVVMNPDTLPASYYAPISGARAVTVATGPEIRVLPNFAPQYRVTSAPAGASLLSRASLYTNGALRVPMLYGGQLGMEEVQPIAGLYADTGSSGYSGNAWNNELKWRLGASLSNYGRLDGKISIAMAGLGELTQEQLYKIAAAMVRNNVASFNPPQWIGFVGDSMTVSTAGGAGSGNTRQCLWANSVSGWQGSVWDMEAKGGRPWVGASPNQSEFFQTMMTRMSWVPDMPRTIVFWAGYNTPNETWDSQTEWEALADHYVGAAAEAAAAGISTVHWSRIMGNDSRFAAFNSFNDYYRDRLAELDGDHIFYDHRLTFKNAEFDGSSRIISYFGNSTTIHLSAAGIAALMADFLARFPNP